MNRKSEWQSASEELILLREMQSDATVDRDQSGFREARDNDSEFVGSNVGDVIRATDTFLKLERNALKGTFGCVRTQRRAKEFVIGEMNGKEEMSRGGETRVA
jgi:hypothetical protein